MAWLPRTLTSGKPPYLALLEQLELAVSTGTLRPGDRLPPHRRLANHFGVSIATVTKAYHEAQRQGLVVGERGRGMFVEAVAAEQAREPELVNLGYSFAPEVGQGGVVARTMRAVMAEGFDATLLSFQSHQGLPRHREAAASWISTTYGEPVDPGNVVLTNGAQHALSIAVAILRQAAGEAVMVEEHSYAGFKALASTYRLPLIPLSMDEEGIIPDVLERVAISTGARILYAMPTIQSPSARTMSPARRAEIAGVIKRTGIWLIEDDVFGFLAEQPLASIARLVPDRSIYIVSFAKVLELGLRLGAMLVPAGLAEAAALAMRATSWSASPIMGELVSQLIASGQMAGLSKAVREESRLRRQVLHEILGDGVQQSGPGGYHVWLPLPPDRDPTDLFINARARGILLTPPGFAVGDVAEHGVRICLGGAESLDALRAALDVVKRLITRSARHHILVT